MAYGGEDYYGEDPERARMHQEAFERFTVNSGTEYPTCCQKTLDFHHQEKFPYRNTESFVSIMEGTAEIVRHNDPSRQYSQAEADAIDDVAYALNNADQYGFHPDLIVKMANDLDLIFWNGRLRDNISIRWATSKRMKELHAGTALGCCMGPEERERAQCRIRLCADLILNDPNYHPLRQMVSTMLHEMCHAHVMSRSAWKNWERDSHGKHFQTRLQAVHARAMGLFGFEAILSWQDYLRRDHISRDQIEYELERSRDAGRSRRQRDNGGYSERERESHGGYKEREEHVEKKRRGGSSKLQGGVYVDDEGKEWRRAGGSHGGQCIVM